MSIEMEPVISFEDMKTEYKEFCIKLAEESVSKQRIT